MRKKGFTLVEVMVAIATSMLLLGCITSTVHFVSSMNNDVLDVSESIYKVKQVRDHILENKTSHDLLTYQNSYKVLNGKVTYLAEGLETIVVEDSTINSLNFTNEKGFLKCQITYEETKTLVFTVGVL